MSLTGTERSVLSSVASRLDARQDLVRRLGEIEGDWRQWLPAIFPHYCTHPFAPHHEEFWRWVWAIPAGRRARPWVGAWARGGGKSSSAEMGVVALGARQRRRYCLWVSGIQDQADDHVDAVAGMLESDAIAEHYPELAERAIGKYGNSKGWRRNRLRTRSGFTIDALGLDSSARGAKLDEVRPDLIVFDDVDSEDDGPAQVERKLADITRKLLPAGSSDLVVIAIQNVIHAESIFARLCDGRADFLGDRIISGPIPAVRDLTYRQLDGGGFEITGGEATWAGQDLARCQEQITEWGLSAFLTEAQHDVHARPGGIYDHIAWSRIGEAEVPPLDRVVCWVDPAVTDKDTSDSQAVQIDGIVYRTGTIYRLYSWEQRTSPQAAIRHAIRKAINYGAERVGVETDQGGDTWHSVYREAIEAVRAEDGIADTRRLPVFAADKAGAGHGSKVHRSQQMLADYERAGRIVHVEGTTHTLERALSRFPRTKPFDLADAAYWSWHDLRSAGPTRSWGAATAAARR